jgi:2-iminobutanoate/2-iminopropanoate deaminase
MIEMNPPNPLKAIATDRAPSPGGHYSQAIACDGFTFVSGQLPIRPDGTHLHQADFETQCRQALHSLFAVLEAAHSRPERVVKVTAYIVGAAHWPTFNSIYAQMFGQHRPARTVVPVPELHYGYLIEVDAIAAPMKRNAAS